MTDRRRTGSTSWKCYIALSALTTSWVPGASAQVQVAVSSVPSCAECKISLSRVTTLGPGGPRPWNDVVAPAVLRDHQGRYLVAPSGDPAVVAVFDAKGRPLPELGRYGSGPGEFISVGWVLPGPGDSVFVLDRGNRRLSVYGPQLRFARSYPLAPVQVFRAASSGNGTVLLQGQSGTPQGAGQPLHFMSSSGKLLKSFGARVPILDPLKSQTDQLREVSSDSKGSVWAARVNRYEIEEWSHNGELRRVLTNSPAWFVPWDANADDDRAGRITLRTGIVALRVDSSGLLWVFLTQPRPGAVAPRVRESRAGEEGPPPPSYRELLQKYRLVIDVIDPRSNTLVASKALNDFFFVGTPSDVLFSLRAATDGEELIDIWRLELRRPLSPRPQ